jgi:transposase
MAKPGPKRTAKYPTEFKLYAVALTRQEGVLQKDVASRLDIHPVVLSRWCTALRDGSLKGELPQVKPADVAAAGELARLRRENARLELELEITKKFQRFLSEQRALATRSSLPGETASESGRSAGTSESHPAGSTSGERPRRRNARYRTKR